MIALLIWVALGLALLIVELRARAKSDAYYNIYLGQWVKYKEEGKTLP